MAIVAVLLGGGVILGMASLSLDVGRVLVEKRELQNSADAASVSLAKDCWANKTACGSNATAVGLANRNSQDGTTTIASVCSVNIPGSPVDVSTGAGAPCASSSGALADCAPLPPQFTTSAMAGLPYVEVRTRTRTTGGSNALSNFFAGVTYGANKTTSVGACSRAAVGTPSDGTATLPLTFSACDWQRATGGTVGGGGGLYHASPNYTTYPTYGYAPSGTPPWPAAATEPPTPGQEVILYAQNPPGGATMPFQCPNWNGHALPGGFGILETDGDPCVIKEYPFHWMHTSTGNNISCNLSAFRGKVINIPIFDCTNDGLLAREPRFPPSASPDPCTTGNGNGAHFHRAGYAQFYLSGYNVNVTGAFSNKEKSLVSGNFPCNGGDRCISGWFLSGSLTASAISGPPGGGGNFGLSGAVPAG